MTLLVEDAALRRKFKRGNKAALVRIYREYAHDLVAFLKNGFVIQSRDGEYFFPGYRNDAWALENAVQEIFARCFQKRAREAYDGLRPFRNYLFTIARNFIIDEFRKHRTGKVISIAEIDHFAEAPTSGEHHSPGDAEKLLQDAELKALVRTFVANLDDDSRNVFKWRFQKGTSIEYAARKLGVTEYRVKKTEQRIRRDFYQWLTRHGYLEDMPFRHTSTQGMLLLLLLVLNGGGQVS